MKTIIQEVKLFLWVLVAFSAFVNVVYVIDLVGFNFITVLLIISPLAGFCYVVFHANGGVEVNIRGE